MSDISMTARGSPEEISGKEEVCQGPPAPHPVFPLQVASTAQPGLVNVNPTYANATYNAAANYGVPTGQVVFVTASSSAQQMQQPQTYGYVMAQQVQQPLSQSERSASTCWLIVGILSAIFCCLPLGIAGAITAYLSKEDAERGSAVNHKRRLCQAKGFTAAAIGVGLLAILAVGITVGLLTALSNDHYDNRGYQDEIQTSEDYDGSRDDHFEVQTWTGEGIYLGCYDDHVPTRDLYGLNAYFGAENSVSTCVKYCSNHGYKYAGLQHSTDCHCGNSYGSHGKLDESKCNYVCEADGRECGGYSYNSVYRTNYLGCFNDSRIRTLKEYAVLLYDRVTPETCTSHCGSQGYEFADVKNYDQCYCGNDPNRYGEISADNCNSPCEGDSSFICGGSGTARSVYKTEHQSGMSYAYLGCYQDSSIRDLSEYYENFGSFTSVEKCVETCAFYGYKYAGLQSGENCYCSHSYGLYIDEYASDCDIDCPVGAHKCGGWDKNSVYRTSYVGCFEDDWERALNVTGSLYHSEVTPSACISECESKGYLFAGTQNHNQCYCGHDMNRYREAPAYECRTPCAGDHRSVCGGSFRNSVYRTTLAQVAY